MAKRVEGTEHTAYTRELRRRTTRLERTPHTADDPTKVPIGDPTGTDNSVAYTDPVSGDPVTVLTFPANTAAIAFAIAGDAYPRIVFRPDGGNSGTGDGGIIAVGDGTFDPADGPNTGHGASVNNEASDTISLTSWATGATLSALGTPIGDVSAATASNAPFHLMGAACIHSAGTNPNGSYAGNVGDLFIRTDDPTTANHRLYICTTGGDNLTAVWLGIV